MITIPEYTADISHVKGDRSARRWRCGPVHHRLCQPASSGHRERGVSAADICGYHGGRGDGSDECRYQPPDGHSEPNHRRRTGYRGLGVARAAGRRRRPGIGEGPARPRPRQSPALQRGAVREVPRLPRGRRVVSRPQAHVRSLAAARGGCVGPGARRAPTGARARFTDATPPPAGGVGLLQKKMLTFLGRSTFWSSTSFRRAIFHAPSTRRRTSCREPT